MRVNQPLSPNIQGAQATDAAKKSEQTAKTDRASKIEHVAKTQSSTASSSKAEISDKAKEFAKAHAAASAAPDVREDKIAEIKRRLESGNYKIDSDAIADKMIADHGGL